MTGAFAILSTASVVIANLMVLSCLLLAGRADRNMKKYCDYNFESESQDAYGHS